MSASSATFEQIPPERPLADVSHSHASAYGEEVVEQEAIYYPIAQRDPDDVRMILRLAFSSLCFAALSLALAGLLTYKLTRSPELIVVERTAQGDRVVGDDRHHTLNGSVQLRADTPGEGDKKYLAAKWAESFFQINGGVTWTPLPLLFCRTCLAHAQTSAIKIAAA